MPKLQKTTIHNCILAFLFVVVFAIFMMTLVRFARPYEDWDYGLQDIDSGWTIIDKNDELENVTLSEVKLAEQDVGDEIYMSRILPTEEVSNPVLYLYSIHCYMKVYLDGELIFELGYHNDDEKRMPGYGLNEIGLPTGYGGKLLEVYFVAAESIHDEGLQAPSIMSSTYRSQFIFAHNWFNIIVCAMLTTYGFVGMVLSVYLTIRNREFLKVFWLAAFTMSTGLWSMCNNDTLSMFVLGVSDKSYIEYGSFFFMGIPLLLYFKDRVMQKEMPLWIKIYFWTITGIQIVFYMGTHVLHYADIAHFPKFVLAQHVLLVVILLFLLLLWFTIWKTYRKVQYKLVVGFGLAGVLALFEMTRYNILKYTVGFSGNRFSSHLAIGVLIIVVTLFYDFTNKIHGALKRDTRNQLLQQLAYKDDLTGLANRRSCEEKLNELEQTGEVYALVNMDMNLLKAINDTFGHQAGDRALRAFAKVLCDVFPSEALVCRTGGDEFAVILPGFDRDQTNKIVQDMNEEMERRNTQCNDEITLSAAYGCAYSDESSNPHAVYKIADQRMYACKKEMHMGRQ